MGAKRWIALLLAGVLLLGLASCGEGRGFTADQLNIWIWEDTQLDTLKTLASGWSEQTGIPVEITVKARETYWQDVEKGMLPDLFWVDSEHLPTCIGSGAVLQLDDLLSGSRTIRLKDYQPQSVQLFQREEHTYAIPRDCLVPALWYNKALFDSMRIDYPDETWTWEDLLNAAETLTNREGGYYGTAILPEDTAGGWYNVVYAYGGGILVTDEAGNTVSGWTEDQTMDAMKLMGRLIADTMPSLPTMEKLTARKLFADGHVAMLLQDCREAEGLKDQPGSVQWSCAVLPYCDRDGDGLCGEGERVSMLQGSGWAISARCADSAAAFSLLESFCSEQAQIALAPLQTAPPAYLAAGEYWGATEGRDKVICDVYRQTLESADLIPVPYPAAGETWLDYAMSDTLPVAWNDPGQMEAMLRQQHSRTAQELSARQTSAQETGQEN